MPKEQLTIRVIYGSEKTAAHKEFIEKLFQKTFAKTHRKAPPISKVEGLNLPGDYFYMKHTLLYSLPITYSMNYTQP